jgi:hypothetical protein
VTEDSSSPDNPFTAYRKSFVTVMELGDSSDILELLSICMARRTEKIFANSMMPYDAIVVRLCSLLVAGCRKSGAV